MATTTTPILPQATPSNPNHTLALSEPDWVKWGTNIRSAAFGGLNNKPFPKGNFSEVYYNITDAQYDLYTVWTVEVGGSFKEVEINIFFDSNPGHFYSKTKEESLRHPKWVTMGPAGWNEWPEGYPSGREQDEDILICGSTNWGLKTCWVQRGRRGTVAVLLQSLAGHLVLKEYADGLAKAVRKSLA